MPVFSFFKKKKLPDASPISSEELELQDQADQMKALLGEAGCAVKTLRCRFTDDRSKREFLYFLVPQDMAEANFGWFSELDLAEWALGRGIVPKDALLERLDGLNEYSRRAANMLAEAGINVLAKSMAVWVVAESRVPGVRVLTCNDDREMLPSGNYTLHQLSVMLSLDSGEVGVEDIDSSTKVTVND